MQIRLTVDEFLILKEVLNNSNISIPLVVDSAKNGCTLTISEDDMDELRNSCQNELEKSGFDIDYEVTDKGRTLESLIDKFFVA